MKAPGYREVSLPRQKYSQVVWCGLLLAGALSCRSRTDEAANLAPAEAQSGVSSLPSVLPASPPSPSAYPVIRSQTPPATTQIALPQNQELPIRPLTEDQANGSVRKLPVGQQQAYLLELLRNQETLSDAALLRLKSIFDASDWLGFGNPETSRAPMGKEECLQLRAGAARSIGDPRCGAPNMVPLYDPNRQQTATDAQACIDQYEFPNAECEYPVVWVRSSEAAEICQVIGKRLCDAHEWEGACAGAVRPIDVEYPWAQMPTSLARSPLRERRLWMEYQHNRTRELRWAYGESEQHALCATGARKPPRCGSMEWDTCGTSTYPSGAFPECVSSLGVYDQHGNAAEHMNLPLSEEELSGRGGIGWTEMKGSWFIFASEPSHPDDCRWRAKSWHTTRITDSDSHRNYHLGFRCCKDIE